ncbi:MAG: hypothetical protein EBT63_02015 [Proteobacteria bacterium]|nr:hypothetical protein [Pseudomonadota bacterium]NCA27882.1 hypothetical protein [Pseudomonadota bacterium]
MPEKNQSEEGNKGYVDHIKTFAKQFVQASLIVPKNIFFHLKDQNTLDGTTRPILERVENFHKKLEIFNHAVDLVFKEKSPDFKKFKDESDHVTLEKLREQGSHDESASLTEKTAQFQAIYEMLDLLNEDEINKRKRELFSNLSQSTSSIIQEREELDNKNFNQIYSRILTSLVLSGLDVLEIFSDLLDNFDKDFAQSVGKTLRDPEVMQGFAPVNETFRIDDTFEGLSKMPILNDINQLALDTLNSDYLSPISGLAHDFIGSEMAKFAFGGLVLATFINSEVSLFLEYKEFDKQHKDTLKDISKNLENKINKNAEQISKLMARGHIDSLRNYEYLKNYLVSEGFKDDKEAKDLYFLDSQNNQIKLTDLTVDNIANIDPVSPVHKSHNNETFKDLIEKAKKYASNLTHDDNESFKKKTDEKIFKSLVEAYCHNKSEDRKTLAEFHKKIDDIKDFDVDQKIEIFCDQYLAPEIKQKIINLKNEIEKSPAPTENPSAQDSIESSSTIPALPINPALTANSSKDQSEDRSDTKREFLSLADSNDDQKSVALSDIELSLEPHHIKLEKSPSQSPSPPFVVQRTMDPWEKGAGVWPHPSEIMK